MNKSTKEINPPTQERVLGLAPRVPFCVHEISRRRPPVRLSLATSKARQTRKVGRGMYAAQGAKASQHQTVVQAALRVPHGVVCLLSALRFHDLTTRSPFEIWLAIDVKARAPKEDSILLRIVRFSGKALASGVDHHTITTSDELWRYAKICRVARVMRPYLEAVV